MEQLVIDLPKSVVHAPGMSGEKVWLLIQREAAVQLYLHYDVSLGYCAHVAGMIQEEFIGLLGEHQICIFEDVVEDQLTTDLENVHRCCVQCNEDDRVGERK